MNKLLKNYHNMDSFELEKHLRALLAAKIIKDEQQVQEMQKLLKELTRQNFVKLMKKEIFNK